MRKQIRARSSIKMKKKKTILMIITNLRFSAHSYVYYNKYLVEGRHIDFRCKLYGSCVRNRRLFPLHSNRSTDCTYYCYSFVHGRGMRYRKGVRYAFRFAEMHLFAKLQATRRAPGEGSGLRYGWGVVQVALQAEKEIVPHAGPVANGRLPRTVSE